MKKNKTNNGKTFWLGLMLIVGAIPATAQEKLEIQITRLGVPQTIEVDRDIEELDFAGSGLTSIILPEGLTSLKDLNLSGNELTSLTLPNGLTNLEYLDLRFTRLTSLILPDGLTNLKYLDLRYNQLRNLFLSPDTASRHERLELFIEDNPWMRIRQLVGMDIEIFDVGPEHYGVSYYDLPSSPKISRVGNGLEISWSNGVLQSAVDVDGPWQDVIASSPLRVTPSLSSEFFRVRSKEQWIDVEGRTLP